jgi:hypothetical protein
VLRSRSNFSRQQYQNKVTNFMSVMTARRAVIFVIVAGSLAAWIAAAATSGVRDVRPAADASPAAGKIDASSAALAGEIARLHDRLHPTVEPRLGRDLFQFAPRRTAAPPPALIHQEVAPAPLPEPSPALTLIGVASDTAEAGTNRTAIIAAPGQLFVVKEGEEIAVGSSRYRVTKISADTAELSASDQSILRLALK